MADFDFPPELLELQKAFFDAEERMVVAARERDDEAFKEAQQAAADAAVALSRSEWLGGQPNRYEARMALRKAARG